MKNFYEATVTKSELTLACCLSLKITHGSVPCVIKVNGKTMFEDSPSGQTQLIAEHHLGFTVPLTEPIEVSIQLIDRQHPNAIQVALTIDGHEILPNYQQLTNLQTCYINTNDIWTVNIDNFYPWLHELTGQGWIA